jgi:PAS domain S-box-containing protein
MSDTKAPSTESHAGGSTPLGDNSDRELQTSATYRALANSLPLSVLIKSCDGRRVFANEAYLKWRGVKWQDVAGKLDSELFPPEIAQRYTEDDQRILASGQSHHAVEQTRVADGSLGWVERIKSPIYDSTGKLLGIQVLFWDVTARIHAEENSRFEQSLLKTLLNNIPDSIYFKDLQSRFIRVSQAMAAKFGYSQAEEIQGLTDADVFSPEHALKALSDERSVIETGVPLVDRIERETWPDQEDTWCLSTKMPLHNEAGEIIGTCGISRDITALKRSEAALKEAVRMADAANRAKSDFLANMSHEIRTPMNALVGMADLLAQTPLNEDQQEYVDTIRRSSDSLLRLLNDILDFSKIEARKLTLETIVFSLTYEIQAALSTLRYQAAKKNLQLRLELASDLPSHFIGDPGRVRQILVNLIGNAVKFTDRGSVTVAVESLPSETSPPDPSASPGDVHRPARLRVSVSDTGIGIAESQQAAVLAPFTQADASMTRRFGGTGLGLSISRQLVELMGGNLRLHSEVGVGSTFYFEIELPVADEAAAVKHEVDLEEDLGGEELLPTPPLRVLVAEDGITNQHVISGLLKSLGHECSIASDGRETLVKWRSESFDVVLMDMHMPVMDGLEATRAIRQHELGTNKHTPIIALTAAAMAEDARQCREAGMDDYLTKPIRRRKLMHVLATLAPSIPSHELASPPNRTSGAIDGGTSVAAGDAPLLLGSFAPRVHQAGSSDELTLSGEHAGCLDLDSARSRIPGGVAGVLRLAAVFRDECDSLVIQLQQNLLATDSESARRNAHTLKGACGLLGAKQLQNVADQIESAAREQSLFSSGQSSTLLQSLQSEAGRVLAAVDELLRN